MPQKHKTLQDIFRERQMKDMKREYYFYRMNQVWTLVKRLALIASLGYGVHWGYKNQSTLKSVLDSHSAPVQELGNNFKEGVNMLKDGLKKENDQEAQAYHNRRQKQIKEYRDMGIDPTIKYAEPGTPEYRAEMDFYRQSGVFGGRK